MTRQQRDQAPQFPPGVDARAILRPCYHSAWTMPGCGRCSATREHPDGEGCPASYRRAITRLNPLLFAITYFGPWLRDPTSGVMSFAPLHLDLAEIIRRWAAPGSHRDAEVAWRGAGKSTWTCGIGPAWALAHGHRRFPVVYSLTDRQAAGKLARLVDVLHGRSECSRLLLADFPELTPVKGGGPGRHPLAGGGFLAAAGMGATTLGEVQGASRPDLLIIDDPQPGEAKNTDEWVRKGKATIRTAILPMDSGNRAAVCMTGTVTMLGDLMDDVVRLARGETGRGPDQGTWLTVERFRCHYHPVDWPQRTTPAELAWLRTQAQASPEHLRSYALTYEPHLLGTAATARYWSPESFRYGFKFIPGRRVISVDPAFSKGANADHTAIAVLTADTASARVCVEHVEQGRWSATETHERIHQLHTWTKGLDGPAADVVLVETNNGSEGVVENYAPYPVGTRPQGYRVTGRKDLRIEWLHKLYVARAVWHRRELEAYEAQAQAWHPRATRDDMLDAVRGGASFLLTGSAAG